MTSLCQVLVRLRSAKLTAKPSKCMIGYGSIECRGHNNVNQTDRPQKGGQDTGCQGAPRPTTKRQMKPFLGLAGFSLLVFEGRIWDLIVSVPDHCYFFFFFFFFTAV